MSTHAIPAAMAARPLTVDTPPQLLSTMDQILPWTRLLELARRGQRECSPARLEMLLRIHLVQAWFGFSDHAAEAALFDSRSIGEFVRVGRGDAFTPSAREIHDFRENMERFGAGRAVKTMVDQYLLANRYFLCAGSRIEPVLGRYDQHSGHLERLSAQFEALSPPYELRDILQFNAIYREVFDQLNPAERRRAEQFVERLIDGAASPAHIPRIFGVV